MNFNHRLDPSARFSVVNCLSKFWREPSSSQSSSWACAGPFTPLALVGQSISIFLNNYPWHNKLTRRIFLDILLNFLVSRTIHFFMMFFHCHCLWKYFQNFSNLQCFLFVSDSIRFNNYERNSKESKLKGKLTNSSKLSRDSPVWEPRIQALSSFSNV